MNERNKIFQQGVKRQYHEKPFTMVVETLEEYLVTADLCLKYYKSPDPSKWSKFRGGVLGYPAAALMFMIVDIIGSYYNQMVLVDGKQKSIKHTNEYFRILNSNFFNLQLSEKNIKDIYNSCRSSIIHNGFIGGELTLILNRNHPFIVENAFEGKGKYTIHLISMYEECIKAVNIFKLEGEKYVEGNPKTNGFFEPNKIP